MNIGNVLNNIIYFGIGFIGTLIGIKIIELIRKK